MEKYSRMVLWLREIALEVTEDEEVQTDLCCIVRKVEQMTTCEIWL